MSNYQLTASLVCANMLDVRREIELLEKGGIDSIHFDVMDGIFVPRYGLHVEMLTAIRSITKLPIDVHMMVVDPEPYIASFAAAGATIFSVQAENNPHLHRTIGLIQRAGMQPGVVLNPATPLSVLDYILDDIKLIMLMAINPGIVGHKLIPSMMTKISDVKTKIGGRDIIIEIDGGVTFDSAPEMVKHGASMLVCGSSTIFRPNEPLDKKIVELRQHIDTTLA